MIRSTIDGFVKDGEALPPSLFILPFRWHPRHHLYGFYIKPVMELKEEAEDKKTQQLRHTMPRNQLSQNQAPAVQSCYPLCGALLSMFSFSIETERQDP